MASFFRWRIADKIIPFLAKSNLSQKYAQPSVISSLIRVSKIKGKPPQLFLPWKSFTDLPFELDNLLDPKELVKYLKNQGLPTAEGFTDINFCPSPTSIVFTVDEHVYSKIVLTDICANDEIIAKSSCLFQNVFPKKIIIECSVPPIGESFHVTHFRSAIHSNFIANINKIAGHEVIKIMHVADWGLLAAAILTGYKQFGIEEDLLRNPIQHLFEISKAVKQLHENDANFREKVNLCFEEMKKGDSNIFLEWGHLRNVCLKQYNSIYEKIGLSFDDTLFDSSYSSEISDVEEDLLKQNLVTIERDGIVIVNAPSESNTEYSFSTLGISPVIHNFSRAICSGIQVKKKHDFDEKYYVSSTTDGYFLSAFFSLVKVMGFQWSENLHHIELRDITTERGKRLRISAEKLIHDAKAEMLKQLEQQLRLKVDDSVEEMAEALGYASLCINDMKHKRKMNYPFNWKDILSFGGHSGVSLQLCHAALKGLQDDSDYIFNVEIDTSPLLQPKAHDLVHHLSRFDEEVYNSYLHLEPCYIVKYLFSLWYFIDRATDSLKLDIKEDRLIVLKARLMLLEASLKVLRKGLHLLGITPYETNYTPPDFVKS